MSALEDWVGAYYGHGPQYLAMGGCVAMLLLGNGHPALQVAGGVLLPASILAPAALEIAATFIGASGEDSDETC